MFKRFSFSLFGLFDFNFLFDIIFSIIDMKSIFIFFCLMIMDSLYAQHERASVTEMVQNMKTYPFSDPDPVANPSDIFYPYFLLMVFLKKV